MQGERTAQSEYLLRMGRQVLAPYTRLPVACAAMITGSAAEGISDHYSDLDMTVYYDGELPTEETLAQIKEANGAPERAWFMGDRADGILPLARIERIALKRDDAAASARDDLLECRFDHGAIGVVRQQRRE